MYVTFCAFGGAFALIQPYKEKQNGDDEEEDGQVKDLSVKSFSLE